MKIYGKDERDVKSQPFTHHHRSPTLDNATYVEAKKRQASTLVEMPEKETSLLDEYDQYHKEDDHHWSAVPSLFAEMHSRQTDRGKPVNDTNDNPEENGICGGGSPWGEIKPTFSYHFPSQLEKEKHTQSGSSPPSNWKVVFRSGLKPFGVQRWPVVTTYILLAVMFMILSGELLLSQQTSNEFLELDPFNVMIGPSIQILIQSGARFPPCMRATEIMPPTERYVCLNTTLPVMNATWTSLKKSGPSDRSRLTLGLLDPIFDIAIPGIQNSSCSLQDICSMSGFANPTVPDQSFRFFTPLFVHSGVIHYLIDGFIHWFVAMDLERVMNPIRFAVVYILSGVFGNAFGANFAMPTNPFMGCGPALFGLFGCSIIDILLMWKLIDHPFRHLIKVVIFIAASFVLGLLPGVDNFTHLGGLISGILIGLVSMPAVYYSRRYSIILIICRSIAVVLYIGLSIIFWSDFYQGNDPGKSCTFCRYVSCLPIGGFCD